MESLFSKTWCCSSHKSLNRSTSASKTKLIEVRGVSEPSMRSSSFESRQFYETWGVTPPGAVISKALQGFRPVWNKRARLIRLIRQWKCSRMYQTLMNSSLMSHLSMVVRHLWARTVRHWQYFKHSGANDIWKALKKCYRHTSGQTKKTRSTTRIVKLKTHAKPVFSHIFRMRAAHKAVMSTTYHNPITISHPGCSKPLKTRVPILSDEHFLNLSFNFLF